MPVSRQAARIALGAVIPCAILVVWHFASRHSAVVPSVASVVHVLIHPWQSPPTLDSTSLASGALISVLRVACGFTLAAITAVPVGLIVGRNRTARDMLNPVIAAEIFPGTRSGLGYMITTAHDQAAYEYAFASIIVIGAIGLVLDGLLRLAAHRVTRWQVKERS